MNPDIIEALGHAHTSLTAATGDARDCIMASIDRLLDLANLRPPTGPTHHQAMRQAMGLDHDHV